jgi:hypothetical protein
MQAKAGLDCISIVASEKVILRKNTNETSPPKRRQRLVVRNAGRVIKNAPEI